ncbi:MAG: chromosomal replication initiator protein DnaA [Clostridia bacterium]|nr:chromosomal replication initiator protein DnaA [Clostridia bacterium]
MSMELEHIRNALLEAIEQSGSLSTSAFHLWFDDLNLESLTSNQAVFSTSADMKVGIIRERYLDQIKTPLKDLIGYEPEIVFKVREDSEEHDREPSGGNTIENTLLLNPDYTFDNFVVGDSNRFAHAASQAVAQNPGYAYNPLLIYGPTGLGKTHLMCAIANQILQQAPKTRIVYVKGEEFTNQLVDSLSKASMPLFREKYRQADVLMIDDIHHIAGKNSVQEEFFNTYNALYDKHKQIIVTTDRPVQEIEKLEDRIRSRLESGLMADVGLPDYELRLAILKKKAQATGLTLSESVLNFLAENLHSNIRQIEGVVKKLRATTFFSDQPLTVSAVRDIVPEALAETDNTNDLVNRIISLTSKYFNLSESDLLGTSRQKDIKNARNIAMYLIKENTQLSLNDIGVMFARDHSTVYSNIQNAQSSIQSDKDFESDVNNLTREIKH